MYIHLRSQLPAIFTLLPAIYTYTYTHRYIHILYIFYALRGFKCILQTNHTPLTAQVLLGSKLEKHHHRPGGLCQLRSSLSDAHLTGKTHLEWETVWFMMVNDG